MEGSDQEGWKIKHVDPFKDVEEEFGGQAIDAKSEESIVLTLALKSVLLALAVGAEVRKRINA